MFPTVQIVRVSRTVVLSRLLKTRKRSSFSSTIFRVMMPESSNCSDDCSTKKFHSHNHHSPVHQPRALFHTRSCNYQLDLTNLGITKNPYEKPLPKASSSFKTSDIIIETLARENRAVKPKWDQLKFGSHNSDHMIEVHWNSVDGWKTPKIVPLHPLSLHPYAKVLHYATECFEGMKAYLDANDQVRLFRPDLNMIRLRLSCARLCLPDFDGPELIEIIKKWLLIDKEWIPPMDTKGSFYIRPTMISVDQQLGVSPPTEAILFVVGGPVGPYFSTGFNPVSLLADPKFVRAWPGGSGDRKLGANYGPTLLIQQEASKLGHQQVMWLYGPDHQITEVGTMNIFVLIKNDQGQLQLITPPLGDGLILPGVTRASLIELVRSWNELEIIERRITIHEARQLQSEGRLLEMFGAGTACIVCPFNRIFFRNGPESFTLHIPETKFSLRLFNELLSIQYGDKTFADWSVIVAEESTN